MRRCNYLNNSMNISLFWLEVHPTILSTKILPAILSMHGFSWISTCLHGCITPWLIVTLWESNIVKLCLYKAWWCKSQDKKQESYLSKTSGSFISLLNSTAEAWTYFFPKSVLKRYWQQEFVVHMQYSLASLSVLVAWAGSYLMASHFGLLALKYLPDVTRRYEVVQ